MTTLSRMTGHVDISSESGWFLICSLLVQRGLFRGFTGLNLHARWRSVARCGSIQGVPCPRRRRTTLGLRSAFPIWRILSQTSVNPRCCPSGPFLVPNSVRVGASIVSEWFYKRMHTYQLLARIFCRSMRGLPQQYMRMFAPSFGTFSTVLGEGRTIRVDWHAQVFRRF